MIIFYRYKNIITMKNINGYIRISIYVELINKYPTLFFRIEKLELARFLFSKKFSQIKINFKEII